MARIFQKRNTTVFAPAGPPAQLIPGLFLSEEFDDGELLISFSLDLQETGGVAVVHGGFIVHLDGIAPVTGGVSYTVPILGFGTVTQVQLKKITAGRHTIELRAFRSGAGTLVVSQDLGLLTVIQLPLWQATPIFDEVP